MKTPLLLILITISIITFSQNKNKLSFEYGSGVNQFSMKNLNQFYIDSFAVKNKLLTNKIQKGINHFMSLKYQPHIFFDVGISINYLKGKSVNNITLTTVDIWNQVNSYKGTFTLKTESIGIGFTNSWYLNSLLKINTENKFLKKIRFATEINAGLGFSKTTSDIQYPDYKQATFYEFFNSSDFQGQIALKVEYDYIKQPIIGTLGLKIGYQYYKTDVVKDKYNEEWTVLNQYPINLDFSGVFGAVYLSFGK